MTYEVRYHPATSHDILQITQWLVDFADVEVAAGRIQQITIAAQGLSALPYRGSVRDEVAPGLRVISAADQNAVITFTVNDEKREVLVIAISYAGSDWMAWSRSRMGSSPI